ncbi:MAG: hypothetical protein UT48_C0001G0079 [Parcubacteria group bacterium GW2011_GWE2_39_37]|uniref:Integral membrane protein CcmA involved in cell shape determination n=1 Tax=Candidatus Falkowbacteria bacterium GW2011_GWF2_39_8 TaxID=1618642 RepID=A0A0G0T796_9BACT|nr:MAG: hypothetical protein UT48_C0001G0079 [Parcubacteria group bacterium GW2011_GWE2_39_37]KKR33712.1 MAG: hypothetical protein UT64_C0004G0019 [Candidatus Falkowbacteria bacterium GW2011_GWF2_39_8]
MFNKDEKIKIKDAETIIGPSVKVKGEFNGQGDIIIEGIFEGTLKTANALYVGDKAKVKADIEAKDARVGGEIIGNLKLRGYLEIGPVAKIFGDIEATSLSVAQGAIINGDIKMSHEKQPAAKNGKADETNE